MRSKGKTKSKQPPNLAAGKSKAGLAKPVEAKPEAPAPVVSKQTELPGTAAATIPKAVEQAAEKVAEGRNALRVQRVTVTNAEGHLLMLMQQHKVPRLVVIDDEGKKEFFVETRSKVKQRKVKDKSVGRRRRKG